VTQLPNAPLTEVVFELRWKLKEDPAIPKAFWIDPGYPVLTDTFSAVAQKHGFAHIKKMGSEAQLAGHSVGLRYYKSPEQSFPLWQIGPGIFAANESAAYEWKLYKRLVLDGVRSLFRSYPKFKGFPLSFIHIELRYIDSFDSRYVAHKDVLKFINEETNLKIQLPEFLNKKPLGTPSNAYLTFEFPVSEHKDTFFIVRLANAKANEKDIILLESRVVTRAENINMGNAAVQRIKYLDKWLGNAHLLTSPFFKQFFGGSLMRRFTARPDNAG